MNISLTKRRSLPTGTTRSRDKDLVRRLSDSEESCNIMLKMSIDEILLQHRRIKEQIAYLINELSKNDCINLCDQILNMYPELTTISKEYLAKTSQRFRRLFSSKSRKNRSGSVNSDYYIPAPKLSLLEDRKDLIRLQAYLNILLASMPYSKMSKFTDILIGSYPQLKAANASYLRQMSPRVYDLKYNT